MISSINILAKVSGYKTIYPFYHAVADKTPLHLKHLYEVRDVNLFEQDIIFFKESYESIAAASLLNNHHEPSFHLTFDDGLREFKEYAFPILKKHKVHVSLFVNPAFVDNKDLFFRFKASLLVEHCKRLNSIDYTKLSKLTTSKLTDSLSLKGYLLGVNYQNKGILDDIAELLNYSFSNYLAKHQPYLTTKELLELEAEGVSIGAHSMDHPLFHKISTEEQLSQVKESCEWVQTNLRADSNLFSFPFTDFGIGYDLFSSMNSELKIDFSFGTAGMKNDTIATHIQRIPMENNKWSAQKIISFQYLYYLVKAPFFKNTIKRF